MSAERPACANCPYCHRETCRRNTPSPAMDSDRAVWPRVEPDDYCGFHPIIVRQEKAIMEGGQVERVSSMLEDFFSRLGK